MTRLVVTADAEADIDDILNYLRKEAGPAVAASYGRKFGAAIGRLVEFPGIGAPRTALGEETRTTVVYPYVLIYDFTAADDTLTLLRVLHGKRNITRRLVTRR
jgi:plasmid stabilization system protein ParE